MTKKITELPNIIVLAGDDVFEVVDISNDPNGSSKITLSNLADQTLAVMDVVTQVIAEAGTDTDPYIWTAERVRQAIEALPSKDDNPLVKGNADGTKQARLDVETKISTGTVRVVTLPDADISLLKHNLTSAVAPTATDDDSLGYEVGSLWVDQVTTELYTCSDASTAAAVWDNLTSGATLPVVDTTSIVEGNVDPTKEMRIDVETNVSTATTRVLEMPDANVKLHKDNLAAAVAPTVTDDDASDYSVGSKWINTTADDSYLCVDASTGAAVWNKINGDDDAIHDNVAGEINAITEKATPVGADLVLIEDSADSNNKKKVQISNIPATDDDAIHDNVAGEIMAITEKVSPVGADVVLIEDSADSNNKKRVQITNLPGGTDADAIHDNVAGEIAAVTEKVTPVAADLILIEDSADSNNKKRIQITNLPGSGAVFNSAYTYDNTTAKADPGAATFRLDNVTMGSVTEMYIDDLDAAGIDMGSWFEGLTTDILIRLGQTDDGAAGAMFSVSGTPVDETGYWTIPLTHVVDGTSGLTDAKDYAFQFEGAGSASIGGTFVEVITVAASDMTTPIAAATDVMSFRMGKDMTLTEVRAVLDVASTGGLTTIDIHKNGSTILSTKLTLDATEETSTTAATPAVISDTGLLDGDKVTFDIDSVPGTPGTGLTIQLIGTVDGAGGGGFTMVSIDDTDSPYAASAGEYIKADTTSGTIEIDLPTPVDGDQPIMIIDGATGAGNWATNNLTVDFNGATVDGDAGPDTLNVDGAWIEYTAFSGTEYRSRT